MVFYKYHKLPHFHLLLHSLVDFLKYYKCRLILASPDELKMPESIVHKLQAGGVQVDFCRSIDEAVAEADIVYMTRVQRERFSDVMEYERVKNAYVLHNDMLADTKPNMRILHPLPRVNEIAPDVDENPKAYWFQQTENGVYTRMAIMAYLFGVK